MKAYFKKIFAAAAAAVMCTVPMTGSLSANAIERAAGRIDKGNIVAFAPGYGCGNEPHVPVVTGFEPGGVIPVVTSINPVAGMTCTVIKTVTCFSHTCSVTKVVSCGREYEIYRGIKTTATTAF